MIYSKIVGSGSCLPPNIVTNDQLAQRVNTSDEWIRTRTGIRQRHIADPGVTSSELALHASRQALADAGLGPQDIDLIILATSTPDYVFPSTACLLQNKLGIHGCPAFDVQAVCSGFIYALATADLFIRSGQHRCALVVGTEVFSRILDWKDRATCVLFGDGAGAVILRADTQPGIYASALHADGKYADILSVPGTLAGGNPIGDPFLRMDGPAVFKFAVRVLEDVARETLARSGKTVADIDWLIPHQANLRILESTTKRLGLPHEKLVVTVDLHGNTSAASVPLALDLARRDGRIKPGDTVMLQGVGGGFTWGAVLARF